MVALGGGGVVLSARYPCTFTNDGVSMEGSACSAGTNGKWQCMCEGQFRPLVHTGRVREVTSLGRVLPDFFANPEEKSQIVGYDTKSIRTADFKEMF